MTSQLQLCHGAHPRIVMHNGLVSARWEAIAHHAWSQCPGADLKNESWLRHKCLTSCWRGSVTRILSTHSLSKGVGWGLGMVYSMCNLFLHMCITNVSPISGFHVYPVTNTMFVLPMLRQYLGECATDFFLWCIPCVNDAKLCMNNGSISR